MFDGIGRTWAFARKDVSSILRQPKLVLTLIVGPFLILALFGVGYETERGGLEAALVVSESSTRLRTQLETQVAELGDEVILALVTESVSEAEALLTAGAVDVVIVAPEDPYETVRNGEQAEFLLLHDQLDPFESTAIDLIADATIDGANRELLADVLASGQEETVEVLPLISAARRSTSLTVDALEAGDTPEARAERAVLARKIEQVRAVVGPTDSLEAAIGESLESDDAGRVSHRLEAVSDTVADVNLSKAAGDDYANEIDELREAERELSEIEEMLMEFRAIEPAVLVSPLSIDSEVVGAADIDLRAFYVPGVIALLLQHVAITFASLSLVRERALGSQDMFRVSPVGPTSMLTGKYLGYATGVILLGGALSYGMVVAFDVPMLGSIGEFAGVLVLLTMASLGVGFLISSIVNSDVQAVNLTMIVLLLSIFFSGFFLTLDRLLPAVRAVSWMLPITHALEAMRTIMFRGGSVSIPIWASLGAGSLVLFFVTWMMLGRRLRSI